MEVWIFVAYPYEFNEQGYRTILSKFEELYPIKFRFADDTASATHLTNKIRQLIQQCDFSMFDLSKWNANVAYEFGIYQGMNRDLGRAWLFLNTNQSADVPADVQGFAQNRYSDWPSFEAKLGAALAHMERRANVEVLPKPRRTF